MKGIFIDNERLKIEPDYRERMGGDYDLQVATLDPGSPNAKLVTAKKIRLGIRSAEPRSLAFVSEKLAHYILRFLTLF